LLNDDKAPELAGGKVIPIAKGAIVRGFPTQVRKTLEGILTNVDDGRHVGGDLLTWPAPRLLQELKLEVIDAERAKMRSREVKELVTSRRSGAGQESHLVVAIEVVLVGGVAELYALEELLNDVWISSRGSERREPI
jgi:hypothetical protein